MIVLVFIIFGLLALSDFPELIKSKKKYEVTVLSILYIFAVTLASMYSLGITIPSPIKWIQSFIVDVLKLGYKL